MENNISQASTDLDNTSLNYRNNLDSETIPVNDGSTEFFFEERFMMTDTESEFPFPTSVIQIFKTFQANCNENEPENYTENNSSQINQQTLLNKLTGIEQGLNVQDETVVVENTEERLSETEIVASSLSSHSESDITIVGAVDDVKFSQGLVLSEEDSQHEEDLLCQEIVKETVEVDHEQETSLSDESSQEENAFSDDEISEQEYGSLSDDNSQLELVELGVELTQSEVIQLEQYSQRCSENEVIAHLQDEAKFEEDSQNTRKHDVTQIPLSKPDRDLVQLNNYVNTEELSLSEEVSDENFNSNDKYYPVLTESEINLQVSVKDIEIYFAAIDGSKKEYLAAISKFKERKVSDNLSECDSDSDTDSDKSGFGSYSKYKTTKSVLNDGSDSTENSKSDTETDTDLFVKSSNESSKTKMECGLKNYNMTYYPFWCRPDGLKTLLYISDLLIAKKLRSYDKSLFCIKFIIQNISYRSVTFRIRSSDDAKYCISPPIGILKSGETYNINILALPPDEWSYVDLHHDSVQILASYFIEEHMNEKISAEKKLVIVQKFWNKFTTLKFPSAEEHVINHMIPCDASYFEEPSINGTAYERFIEQNWKCFSFYWEYNMPKPHLSDFDLYMFYKQFSVDPGVTFVRDRFRSMILKRNLMKKFRYGDEQTKKLAAVFCTSFLIIMLGFCGHSIYQYFEARQIMEEFERNSSWSNFFNFFPISYFY